MALLRRPTGTVQANPAAPRPMNPPAAQTAPNPPASLTSARPAQTGMARFLRPSGGFGAAGGTAQAAPTGAASSAGAGGFRTKPQPIVPPRGNGSFSFTPGGGSAGLPGAAGGGIHEQTLQEEADELQKDIMQQHKDSWGGIQSGISAQNALNTSRNAEINAAMGRNIGGGFWGGQAQVQLGTQQNLANAALAHQQQGQNLQLNWLDKILRRNERSEDRAFELAGESSEVGGAGSGGGPTNPNGSAGLQAMANQEGGSGPISGDGALANIVGSAQKRGIVVTDSMRQQIASYVADYFQRTGRYPSFDTVVNGTNLFSAVNTTG